MWGFTLELGPELEFERAIKRAQEVDADRFTSLDRGILKDAKDHVLVVTARLDGDRQRAAWRLGRLRRLEAMGLAEEKQVGVWAIDHQLGAKLRSAPPAAISTVNAIETYEAMRWLKGRSRVAKDDLTRIPQNVLGVARLRAIFASECCYVSPSPIPEGISM